MFILSKLKLGQRANAGHLKTLIENQSYQIHGTLVYGDIMQWVGGDSIKSVDHLNYAPEGTQLYMAVNTTLAQSNSLRIMVNGLLLKFVVIKENKDVSIS